MSAAVRTCLVELLAFASKPATTKKAIVSELQSRVDALKTTGRRKRTVDDDKERPETNTKRTKTDHYHRMPVSAKFSGHYDPVMALYTTSSHMMATFRPTSVVEDTATASTSAAAASSSASATTTTVSAKPKISKTDPPFMNDHVPMIIRFYAPSKDKQTVKDFWVPLDDVKKFTNYSKNKMTALIQSMKFDEEVTKMRIKPQGWVAPEISLCSASSPDDKEWTTGIAAAYAATVSANGDDDDGDGGEHEPNFVRSSSAASAAAAAAAASSQPNRQQICLSWSGLRKYMIDHQQQASISSWATEAFTWLEDMVHAKWKERFPSH